MKYTFKRVKYFLVFLPFLLITIFPVSTNAWSNTDSPIFLKTIPSDIDEYRLSSAFDIKFVEDDSFFVLHYSAMYHFTSEGKQLVSWGAENLDGYSSWTVEGFEILDEHNLLVSDSSNNKVHKFTYEGEYVESFDNSFSSPKDVAVDNDGRIYVMDLVVSQHYQVEVYNSDYSFTGQIIKPAGDYFYQPWSIRLGPDGNLWVMDTGNRKFRIYSTASGDFGTELLTFGSSGAGLGEFNAPSDVAYYNGYLYICEVLNNNRIQKLSYDLDPSTSPVPIETWGGSGTEIGELFSYALDINNEGKVHVIVSGHLMIFDSEGNFEKSYGGSSKPGEFDTPYGIEKNMNNNFYVSGRSNNRVQIFDSDFNFLSSFGSEGAGNGEFNQPTVVRSDSSGNIYVMDTYNHRAQKFDSQGNYIPWTGTDISDGSLAIPHALEVKDSRLYISEYTNNRVQVFDLVGNRLLQFGGSGVGNGLFNRPYGVAVDGDGYIYVADCNNHLVQKFDAGGNFTKQWGGQGENDGQMQCPVGLRIHDDIVYVVERLGNRVQAFDLEGNFQHKFGSEGLDFGQFDQPRDIEVVEDENLYLYVSDSGNNRIQKYVYDRKAPQTSIKSVLIVNGNLVVEGSIEDDLSIVDKINMSIQTNGNKPLTCEAKDGKFDELAEEFVCTLENMSEGEYELFYSFSDFYTNEGEASAVYNADNLELEATGAEINYYLLIATFSIFLYFAIVNKTQFAK